jgi:hypothetical protein
LYQQPLPSDHISFVSSGSSILPPPTPTSVSSSQVTPVKTESPVINDVEKTVTPSLSSVPPEPLLTSISSTTSLSDPVISLSPPHPTKLSMSSPTDFSSKIFSYSGMLDEDCFYYKSPKISPFNYPPPKNSSKKISCDRFLVSSEEEYYSSLSSSIYALYRKFGSKPADVGMTYFYCYI